ncbi:MAG TPA: efflux RND transporter permease subunit [Syntrophomonadaceae bacterium]|nr:efflux RND transporter permease subunit [Syntrophomonadaceae bacterium]
MKKFNLAEWSLKNRSVIYFFIILLFSTGIFSYVNLGRMEFPDYTIRQMVVSVGWPGASAKQVEEQVTDKIEKQLQNTPGLDFLESYSMPGQAIIYVNLKMDANANVLQPTWFKVRNEVNDIKDTLPAGVVGPYFNDDFADVFGTIYAVTSDGFTYEDMRAEAEHIRRTLLDVKDVKRVELSGVQPEKIYVEIESSKLAKLGVDPNAIINTLQGQNAMSPAGMVETASDRVYLRVSGMFDDIESIRNLPIHGSTGTFRLEDIAKVERAYADPPEPEMYFNGKPAIGINISMDTGGNILNMGKALDGTVANIKKDLPLGMEVNKVADQSSIVKDAVNEFVITLALAILIVLLVCFISLGLRTGGVVAICIPLVIAGVLTGMNIFGIDLHKVSLGSLVLAMGLLVDDAIIVIESMMVKLEQGSTRNEAAGFAFSSTAGPRLTGALITCAGFIPLGLSKGSTAEMLGCMLWVVTMALLISWLVAGTATPLLGYHLIKVKGSARHANDSFDSKDQGLLLDIGISDEERDIYNTKFYRKFKHMLTFCLNRRKLVLGLTGLALVLAVSLMSLARQDFFPPPSRPEIVVDFRLPEGASIKSTDAEAQRFAQCLNGDKDISYYTYYTGQGAQRFLLSFVPSRPDTNYSQFIIVAKDLGARDRVLKRVDSLVAQQFPAVRANCRLLQSSPMFPYSVMLRVTGPDEGKVREIAKQVEDVMSTQSYLRNVNLDWNEKSKVLHLEVDQDKARILGVNTQSLSLLMQAQLSGAPITEYREGDKMVSIVFRIDDQNRTNLDNIKNLSIPLPNGQWVSLDQVAKISYDAEEGLIGRRDLKPTITAQAEVAGDITEIEASNKVYDSLKSIRGNLPSGYTIQLGANGETSEKAIGYLMEPVPLMIIVILILLMLQLRSIPKMFLTLMTAPLGIIGVGPALLLTNQPICFVVVCGILALAGIIMRNSIILIDQIEKQLAAGESTWNAIINATVLRFRPIMLTASAAILGMLPLTTSVLWGPMAVAMAGGLAAATVLTLIVLPVMYAAWYKVNQPIEASEASKVETI